MIILSIGSNLSSKFGDRHQNLLKTISLLEKKGAQWTIAISAIIIVLAILIYFIFR